MGGDTVHFLTSSRAFKSKFLKSAYIIHNPRPDVLHFKSLATITYADKQFRLGSSRGNMNSNGQFSLSITIIKHVWKYTKGSESSSFTSCSCRTVWYISVTLLPNFCIIDNTTFRYVLAISICSWDIICLVVWVAFTIMLE